MIPQSLFGINRWIHLRRAWWDIRLELKHSIFFWGFSSQIWFTSIYQLQLWLFLRNCRLNKNSRRDLTFFLSAWLCCCYWWPPRAVFRPLIFSRGFVELEWLLWMLLSLHTTLVYLFKMNIDSTLTGLIKLIISKIIKQTEKIDVAWNRLIIIALAGECCWIILD